MINALLSVINAMSDIVLRPKPHDKRPVNVTSEMIILGRLSNIVRKMKL